MDISELNLIDELAEKLFHEINETDDLVETVRRIPEFWYNVSRTYEKQREILNKMKIDRDRLYGELYEEYRYDSDKTWTTKSEIDSQINRNDKFFKSRVNINEQEAAVHKLEGILQLLKSTHYFIQSAQKLLEIKQGF